MMNRSEWSDTCYWKKVFVKIYFDHHVNVDQLKGIYQLMDDQSQLRQLVTNDHASQIFEKLGS